mmetsp:Transcript_9788/g.16477  ORF Transcript_9788/g.16477 Transcript_9788/m.16477 type:complete len:318 (+) Transcript_9788:17-970(+)
MTDIDTNHKSSNNVSNADDDDNDERLQNIIFETIKGPSGVDGDQVTVRCVGNPKSPALFTYHDFGLDFDTCFGAFFNHPRVADIFANFFVVHIVAPGQQENADPLPPQYEITMESLVNQIEAVRKRLGVDQFFSLGVGLGAVVMLHYACAFNDRVKGQILVSATHKPSGWLEWCYARAGAFVMWLTGANTGVLHAQLLARYYDAAAAEREPDAYAQCAASLARVPPAHLAALIRAYAQRPPLTADALRRLRARTLVWSARNTYYQEDALDLIAQLPPADTAFMQFDECGYLILEEKPDELVEPLTLFFQGFGLCRNA